MSRNQSAPGLKLRAYARQRTNPNKQPRPVRDARAVAGEREGREEEVGNDVARRGWLLGWQRQSARRVKG